MSESDHQDGRIEIQVKKTQQKQQASKDRIGHWITIVMGALTIICSIAISIPAFIALNRDRPDVYFQAEDIFVLNPDSPDYENLISILQQNQVPDSRFTLKIRNTGNGAAQEVKIGFTVDGSIHEITTSPSAAQKPAWVDIPNTINSFKDKPRATFSIRNLATTKTLAIDATYRSYKSSKEITKIDVFCAGKPATQIPDIEMASQRSVLYEFRYVFYVLGSGIALVLITSIVIVGYRNREYVDLLYGFAKQVLETAATIR